MVFSLLKKDFLIVKKYVLIMFVLIFLIPPFVQSRTPEFTGVLGFILSVIYVVLMLLQYVSLKEYQYPKAATLLCATPFSRKAIVLSKYIFCMVIYFICCIAYEIETLIIPGLGTADISLFAFMFLVTSVFVGLYLPVQYKLGYEKTRFIFMVVIIASPIILPLFMRMESLNMDFLSTLSPYLICVGIIFVGFVVLAISASLSMKIYEKTDLA
jgi:ABC-2 type transport system permease protein